MPGSKKYFIDTNIFVRFFVPDDFHKDCKAVLSAFRARELRGFTSALVLMEVQYVLNKFYNFPKEKVVQALEVITCLQNLEIEETINFKAGLQLYRDYNVKFIDCLIAALLKLREEKVIVVSYDRDFDKLGIKRIEPKGLKRQGLSD